MLVRVVIFVALAVGLASLAPRWFAAGSADQLAMAEPESAVAAPPVGIKHGAAGSGRAAIYAGVDGHFRAEATIRGRRVSVVVDTGATVVALNQATARELGVQPSAGARRVAIQTANGTVQAAAIVLPDVVLGGIRVNNVEAVVLPDRALGETLLGMSFLGRLKEWKAGSGRLELVQ